MDQGSMPEDWIGGSVDAFPDSEGLIVRGILEGVSDHGLVINIASRITAGGASGYKGPHFFAWREIRWMHPTEE